MSKNNTTTQSTPDEFYVGYLPTPVGHRKFITLLIPVLFIWSLGIATIITLTMRSPGEATWDTGAIQTWSGTLIESPYPILIPDNIDQEPPLFVVEMGKRGAHERLAPFFGRHITIAGYELRRNNRRIIELSPDQDAITPAPGIPAQAPPRIHTLQPTQLTGEIVDGKCYLGAMKPGDGAGHRACATLCIQGGLPPMFATQTESGEQVFYLLTVDGSTNYSPQTLALIGRQVRISGHFADLQGTQILQTTSQGITLLKD